ncbi:MAG: hypothetical protein ACPGUE_14800 [Marinomonas sp.]
MAGEKNSKYKPEYDALAYNYCLLGATDKQLGSFFGVSEQTINTWKEKHPTFLESLNNGKVFADAEVAKSLHKRALGYEYVEEKQEDGTNGSKTTTINKHVAGDTTAAIFWLKNRQPTIWRDKKEVDMSISDDFDSLLDDAADD